MNEVNSTEQGVFFTRLPISLPCATPVVPTTGVAVRNGEPVPMEERTEFCAVDAFWMMGALPCCDIHLRDVCALIEVDYEGLLVEAAHNPAYGTDPDDILAHWREGEKVPWSERHRYEQESVQHPNKEGQQ